MIYLEEIR